MSFEFADGVMVSQDRHAFLREWMATTFPELPPSPISTELSHGTLGTLLAFLQLFKRIAEDDRHALSLVVEDDSVINGAFDFGCIKWDALHESGGNSMFTFVHRSTKRYGLWAQLVSREGAQFMVGNVLDVLRANIPIDFYIWEHPSITRYNLFASTGAWLFQQVAPENHVAHSERLRINMWHNGHARDYAVSRK